MLARIYRRRVAEESGAVLLLMALMLPVIVLLLAMSMDFGNWYVHKRQFENRVKAGALAAGVAYGTNFAKCTSDTATAESNIRTAALKYAGAAPGDFNRSAGDANDGIVIAVNAAPGGPCFFHAPDSSDFASPLGGYWTNVSAVAAEVPSFFSGFGVPKPKITASARVALMTAETVSGMRPLGLVNAASTTCVRATFQGAGSVDLTGSGTTWTGTAPSMPSNDSRVSIRVGCGSNYRDYANMAYVTRVQTGPQPQLTNLQLAPTIAANCNNNNPYFIPRDGNACQMQLTATVTFANNAAPKFVRATVGGGAPLTLTNGSGNDWTGTFTINPGSGTGPNGLQDILITARNAANGPFADIGQAAVQAGTAANQGPIANVTLAHAMPSGSQIGTITVTLRGLSSADLRMVDGGTDCAPGGTPNLQATFTEGCAGPFMISNSATCTNSAGDNNPPNPAGPFDCVGGIGNGQLASLQNDYDDLWAPGNACTPNNWPNTPIGDPRLISVFLTDGIPNTQDANDEYRITGFAAFYVTGWKGAPGSCANEAPPESNPPNGSVWGRVVPNYVIPSSEGSASATPCTAGSTTLCIAALVK